MCVKDAEGMLSNFVQEVEREKSFRRVMEELEQLAATKEMLLKVSQRTIQLFVYQDILKL